MTTIIKLLIALTLFLFNQLTFAQQFTGQWTGILDVQGTELPLVLDITQSDSNYSGTLTSPKQSKEPISISEIGVSEKELYFSITDLGIKYKGEQVGEKLEGTFEQGPMKLPLTFERKVYEDQPIVRPQEPKGPFSYTIEEVTFVNKTANGITLAGTFTKPKDTDNPPVAVMISGSGPQDRDESVFGHKPFWVIADHLSSQGIAVLRFDDRGVGASQGNHENATSADFATDVAAAVAYLKGRTDINPNAIGLIGHSEGGFIAPMVAKDPTNNIAFIVSMAGTGVKGDGLLVKQMRRSAELLGSSEDLISFEMNIMEKVIKRAAQKEDPTSMQEDIVEIIKTNSINPPAQLVDKYSKDFPEKIAAQFSSSWMTYFLSTDPGPNWKQTKCSVLAINGSLDYQVFPKENLDAIGSHLKAGNNPDITVKEFPGLNHLFQTATSGSGAEYALIEETIAPQVLETITVWINERF